MFQFNVSKVRNRGKAWLCTFGVIAASVLAGGSASAAPPDTMPIWRLQVRFITADVSDAGTDSKVWIKLNDNNRTYIDSGRDDRERNRDETYELRLDGVNTLADIDYFRIQKNGDDGWALRHIMLIVNNRTIFEESFPGSPHWMDNENGDTRTRFTDDFFMRQHSAWVNYVVPTRPSVIPLADTEIRVEALHGDWTSSDEVHNLGFRELGNNTVVMNATGINTWNVHVAFYEEDTWLIGQDINLDFNLHIGCVGGRPDFTVSSVNASSFFETYTPEVRAAARQFVNGLFRERLNEMMKGFRYVPFCPSISLDANGAIHFASRFPVIDFDLLTFDTLAPVDLNVQTGGGIKPYAPTNFVATVMSRMKSDSKAELVFELPAQVEASDTIVEVRPVPVRGADPRLTQRTASSKGAYRTLNAQVKKRGDGTSALYFSDALAAGQNVEYTLHLVYQPKEDGAGQIVTTIQPLGTAQRLVTPLKSVTDFSFKKGEVFPEGTTTTASHYIGEKPVWTERKPPDGR